MAAMYRHPLLVCLLGVCAVLVNTISCEAQVPNSSNQTWPAYQTPTPLPTVAPELVRKAFMNCLLEVDRTEDSISGSAKARKAEAETQRIFCENRKRECGVKKDGIDCRTFVEEFTAE
jgi:hypothetical protein